MSSFTSVRLVYYQVSDWERAKKFYAGVLEWPVAWADDELGWMEFGRGDGVRLAISRRHEPTPSTMPGAAAVAVLNVENAYRVTDSLRAKGVRCDEVVSIPGDVTYGTFYDPDGNRIQFASNSAHA